MGVEVCPVHKSEFKSFQISSIHVGAMLHDPQPRGVKRKFPDDDDPGNGDLAPNHYCRQRLSVFNMSVCKLNRFRQTPDPSLLRSVLICNTLRSIEQEMEREGIKINCYPGGSFLPPVNCQVLTLDPPPSPHINSDGSPPPVGCSPSSYNFDTDSKPSLPSVISTPVVMNENTFSNSNANYSADYDRCLVDIDSSSSGRITPFVRTAYDRVESGALWTDEADRLTSLNWSSVLNFNSSSTGTASSSPSSHITVGEVPSANGQFDTSSDSSSGSSDSSLSADITSGTETSLHMLMPPSTATMSTCMSSLSITYSSSPSTSPNTSPSSGNTSPISGSSPTSSSEDEIFRDVDLSLYDFDLLSPLSPPNVKMAPVSADELIRSLSNNSESTNSCPAESYYKNEYFGEEREQVTAVRS